MIRNYLKIAFRNLTKNKGFSILNITGLSIGMASAVLILLWMHNEMSYDHFHAKTERIYEAWNRSLFDGKIQCWGSTPKILTPTLKKGYPEVERATSVNWPRTMLFSIGDKHLNVEGTMVYPDFLYMFDFPLIEGDIKSALGNVYSIVITENLAKKLFGKDPPLGKIIKINNSDNFTVTGILKDLPNNTRFKFEFLLPWEYMEVKKWDDSSWGNNSTETFVLLKEGASPSAFNNKIKNITKAHLKSKDDIEIFLYPLSRLRLYSKFENGKPAGGRISTVRTFGIIAVFILLIACINFMNLSTARSEKRAKEVGIRKVVGAQKKSLVGQFIGESILIASIAGILALCIVQLSLPSFNRLVEKQLFIDYGNPYFWAAALGFTFFTGIVAGSYPAFFLSSFSPVRILKGTYKAANALITPRKVLVVLQFTFAIILIICTVVVNRQIQFAQDRETGYDRNNLVYVFLQGDIEKKFDLIKNELLNSSSATSVSKTSAPMTDNWSDSWGFRWQGKDPNAKLGINIYCTDGDLVKTTGMRILSGRDIDLHNYPSDSTACVLNESAVHLMNFKNPLGQQITEDNASWHVIGVVSDFILESPYRSVKPMIIEGPKGWFNVLIIKLNRLHPTAQNLAAAEKIFKKFNPWYPFEYHFVDADYARKFDEERRTGTLSAIFGFLTIFISSLGLFGLATYMAENRIKEIGVRKVLGASIMSITTLLSKDFIRLIFISFIVASPIAWLVVYEWLKGFNYRIGVDWFIFLFAGGAAVMIALVSISYQAIKAAISNPVKSLRRE